MKTWWLLGLGLTWVCSAGWAVDWKTLQPQGYVSDFAQVIDQPSKARLESYCAEIEHSTGAQMALVTISGLEGEPIEEVATTIFRAWGVGQKGKNNGVLLLLAIQNRRSRLEVGEGLRSSLPDNLARGILNEMRPALRKQDYGDALMAAAETIGNAIGSPGSAAQPAKSSPAPLPRRARPHWSEAIPWAVLIGAVVILMVLSLAGGTRGYSGGNTGAFLAAILASSALTRDSWGSRGSGGFGGFDSGDGFGGFGGGDTGGGGASSDW
jgi:uncharacterized protein